MVYRLLYVPIHNTIRKISIYTVYRNIITKQFRRGFHYFCKSQIELYMMNKIRNRILNHARITFHEIRTAVLRFVGLLIISYTKKLPWKGCISCTKTCSSLCKLDSRFTIKPYKTGISFYNSSLHLFASKILSIYDKFLLTFGLIHCMIPP